MTRISYVASADDNRLRIDTFLGTRDDLPSRSAAVKLIESGQVLVNGQPVDKKYLIKEKDVIEYDTIEERPQIVLKPQYIPLDIRYEDDHLLVLSKQIGLVCHPSPGHEDMTLVNALLAHCGAEHLGMLQGEDRPGIVHRLDKDTSGLMLAAKSTEVQASLQDAIKMRTVDRRYLALVHGYIAPDTGLIDAPIARGAKDRMRMEISDAPGARSCVTTFTVVERFEAGNKDNGYTLIECKLYTGRTHQIRLHMEYIGHPCVGDQQYGHVKEQAQLGLKRQFLHSYSLEFEHPVTGKNMSFVDGLPDDLQEAYEAIRSRSIGRTGFGEEVFARIV